MNKPPIVEAVLGELIRGKHIQGEIDSELYAYPSGYGSSWSKGDEVVLTVTTDFPKYPTNSVCQVEVEESVRPGYIITRARQVDTSNPENGFYGQWYDNE